MTTMTAERPRYQINLDPLAEIGDIYRRWSDGIREFRAELDAIRGSRILELHMPDGPEARRRRGLLAPLAQPQPSPYAELAPDKLAAEAEQARQRREQRKAIGWVPNVPDGVRAASVLTETADVPMSESLGREAEPATEVGTQAPTSNETASQLEVPRDPWWMRWLRVLGVGA